MPENALALAIKPPEPINTDMSKLFGTIANLQLSGAHAGLYSLQAAQEARKLHGMNIYARTGDTEAALRAGADPATMQTAQEMHYKQSVRDRNQGYDTADTERLAKTSETQVETAQKLSNLKRDRLAAEASFMQGLPLEQRGMYLAQALSRMARDGVISPDEANGITHLHNGQDADGKPNSDRALNAIIRYGQEGTKKAQEAPFVEQTAASEARGRAPYEGPKAAAIAAGKLPAEVALKAAEAAIESAKAGGGSADPAGAAQNAFTRMGGTASPALPGGFSPTPIASQPPAAAPASPAAPAAPGTPTPSGGVSFPSPSVVTEQRKQGEQLAEYDKGLRESHVAATNQNALIDSMLSHMGTWRQGKWAAVDQQAREIAQAVASSFGIKETRFDKPIADYASFQKVAVQLLQKVVRETSPRAAVQEMVILSKSLPSTDLTEKGTLAIAGQMQGLNDYSRAKFLAAEDWKANHGSSVKGFEEHWSRVASPGYFIMHRLSPEDFASAKASLAKTAQGRNLLQKYQSEQELLSKIPTLNDGSF